MGNSYGVDWVDEKNNTVRITETSEPYRRVSIVDFLRVNLKRLSQRDRQIFEVVVWSLALRNLWNQVQFKSRNKIYDIYLEATRENVNRTDAYLCELLLKLGGIFPETKEIN